MSAESPRRAQAAGLGLLAVVLVSACGPYDPGFEGGSYAPQVLLSFPDSGTQTLVQDSALTFEAEGEDADSLEIDWEWQLDEVTQTSGESTDGTFDTGFLLEWGEDLSGAFFSVRFAVTDGDHVTELVWPVSVQ